MLPVVAIVGRPNVGKSSLFNRLAGKRAAIESEVSGTTRDQISRHAKLFRYEVLLVDTGGLEIEAKDDINVEVQRQARMAIEGADVIVFVLDVRDEATALDYHVTDLLRKSGKKCIVVTNKCDHPSQTSTAAFNFYELGLGDPLEASAIHGLGLEELRIRIEEDLDALGFSPEQVKEEPKTEGLRITFVGRPNVGKSSLVNALFGKEKVIVSSVPGTTRDSIDVPFTYEGTSFVLVDTAGLRKPGKIERGIEKFSVIRSFQAIDESDVVGLVLNGDEGLFAQDLHVCEFVLEQHKGLILIVNKMDLFDDEEKTRNWFMSKLKKRMPFLPWAPVVFSSALHRKNIFAILDVAKQVGEERARMLGKLELDAWLDDAIGHHGMAGGKGVHEGKVFSVKQVTTNPPTFIFSTKNPSSIHFSYRRYLENSLREKFGFVGTAIKLIFSEQSWSEAK